VSRGKFQRRVSLFLTLFSLCFCLCAQGQSDEERTRQQLKKLHLDIQRVNQQISSERARKNTLQEQLKDAEVRLGALQGSVLANESSLVKARKQLTDLKIQRGELEAARDAQRESISAELKSAYQMGRQGQVKILLNQEQPDTVARTMSYHRYVLAARSEHIANYRKTLEQIATLEPKITALSVDLEKTGLTLERQRKSLGLAQKNRQLAVVNLAASIQSKGGRLKQMDGDRKELERLLDAIKIAVVNLEVPDNYKAFKSAMGKMPWPVAGRKPSNRFGNSRNEGKMRWQGLSIPAREGTPVAAIHHGRVVYADWFRGSGLLLIIDHGDGYMSLYAHNQTLFKEVGEWVTAGTPVSTVGSSGGQDSAALYFEIRHQGKPTNPANWCRG
jgi:septal ring factor EnvC (AmiA/AmiB activator)